MFNAAIYLLFYLLHFSDIDKTWLQEKPGYKRQKGCDQFFSYNQVRLYVPEIMLNLLMKASVGCGALTSVIQNGSDQNQFIDTTLTLK